MFGIVIERGHLRRHLELDLVPVHRLSAVGEPRQLDSNPVVIPERLFCNRSFSGVVSLTVAVG